MTYFACQLKKPFGYKLSTLILVPEFDVQRFQPIQWRKTNITPDEFTFINNTWSKQCTPQSNWTIERWMIDLEKCIEKCRKKQAERKKQIEQKKHSLKDVIFPVLTSKPIEPIEPIKPIEIHEEKQPEVIEILEPINADLKYRDGVEYELISDDSEPTKQIANILGNNVREFLERRFKELSNEFGVTSNCSIDFKLELYFDEL